MVLAASGCVKHYALRGGASAPGADGTVAVATQEGGNVSLDIDVSNLLPPDRVSAGLTQYAVWVQTEHTDAVRLGTLNYDEEKRRGSMMATTPFKNFQLIVSGEATSGVASPSEHVVFRSAINIP